MTDLFVHNQPKTEFDIKCSKDCMIRAVVNVTGKSYSEVHKIMYKHGWRATRKKSKDNWELQITKTLEELGFEWCKEVYQAIKGEKRMNIERFVRENSNGKFILRVSKHVTALIDGKIHDTWCKFDKCVYFIWKVQ